MLNHMISEDVWTEIGYWVWSKGEISNRAAITIASWYQCGINAEEITHLSQKQFVRDKTALRHEILLHGKEYGYSAELAALLNWVDKIE